MVTSRLLDAGYRGLATTLIAVAAGCATGGPESAAPTGTAPERLDPPPAAPSEPVTDTLHGVAVVDPYRNFEDVRRPDTLAWLRAQGAYADRLLGRIEGRDELLRRIESLTRAGGDAVRALQRLPGDRLVYLLRRPGDQAFKLVVRDGLGAPPRVLFDPEALARATGVPHAINYVVPSWDGRSIAYGVSAGGSEDATLQVIDVASGRAVGPALPRVREPSTVHWAPDSRTLTYNQVRALPADAPETEVYLDSTVFRIRPHDRTPRPVALFGPLVDRTLGLERLDVGQVFFAPGSRWMVARTTDTTVPEGRLFVAPLADLERPRPRWRAIATAADRIVDARLQGDRLFLQTHAGAPRGRVLALPLQRPALANATTVIGEPADGGVLESFRPARGGLEAEIRSSFGLRARSFAAGTPRGAASRQGAPSEGVDLAPGVAGSTQLVDEIGEVRSRPWLTVSSWTEPSRIVALADGGLPMDTGLLDQPPPPDAPAVEVREVRVPAADGTPIPLAILQRRGQALDGRRPTLLFGYGAYGLSFQAGFDPRTLAWVERGGVLAFANVRGSGAFGDDWHRAGYKATKPNTWNDGIACARWLIAQGYASPATLGVRGGSAGGIFAGRAVTTAPELFAAGVFDVGLLDAIRAETTANGITNTAEFGTVAKPDEFRGLLEMSTYHQIRNGVAYPGVLLVHGLNDPRVEVWHSAKTAARLQAATSSGRPVLLRLDEQAGHGIGSTARQSATLSADVYAFLLWQFGMAKLLPPAGAAATP